MDGERGLSSISSGVWTLLLLVRVPLLVVLVFALMVLDYLVQDATFEAIRFVVLDRPEQLGMIGALLFAACFALRFTAEAMILLVAPHLIKSRVGWVAWALPRLIALAPAAILGARFFVVGQDGDSFLASGDPALFDPAVAQGLACGAGLYFALIGVAVAVLPKTAKAAGEEEGLGFARLGALTPASGITLLALIGAAVAVFFMFWDWSNVAPAQFVGPVGVVLLWAFAASMYFFPVAFASHATRLPLLLLLLGAAIAFSEYNLNDNHQIRTVTLRRPEKIPYFNQDLSLVDWLRAREDLDLYDYEHYPIFVIAAEGGAMRSAYFTARVLKTLQDVCPAFAHHTIGISAVSGGSVGAASFIALNTLRRAPMKGDAPCDFSAIPQHRAVQDSLDVLYSKDFLSPLLGAALFPDALQRLLPVAIPEFDRARAIECAFESGLNDATASAFNKEPCKDRYLPLNRIYGGVHRWYETQRALGEKRRAAGMRWVDRVDRKTALNTPHLFLNTTDVTLGVPVPIVTGRVPYRLVRPRSDGATTSGSVQSSFQPTSADGGGTVDLPLSVAAFLSARFPFFMPAGWHQPYYRFIDGGLFEDSGSWFAEQTVRYLEGQIEEVRAAPEAYTAQFRHALLNASITVIVLRATPCESDFGKVTRGKTLPPHLSGDVECVQQTLQTADEGSNEIGSPVRALLRTRLGRGYDALESLRAYAKDQGRAFFERLAACTDARDVCLKKIEALQENQSLPVPIQVREVRFRNDPHVHIPLTWTLSRQAKAHLDEAIETPLDQYRQGGAAVASRFGVGIAPPNYNAVVCALAVRQSALFESAPAACKTAGALPDWQRPLETQGSEAPAPSQPPRTPPLVQPVPEPPLVKPPVVQLPVPQPTPPKPKDAKPPLPEIDQCEGCPPKTP